MFIFIYILLWWRLMVNTINNNNNSISFNNVDDKTKTANISDIEDWDTTLSAAGFDEDHAQLIEDEVKLLIEEGATYEDIEKHLQEKGYDVNGDGVLDSSDKSAQTNGTIDLDYVESNLHPMEVADTDLWLKKLYDAGIGDLPLEDRQTVIEYLNSGISNKEAYALFKKLDENGNDDGQVNADDIAKLEGGELTAIIEELDDDLPPMNIETFRKGVGLD